MDDVVACSCYAPGQANELRRLYEAHRQKFVHEVEPRCLNMHFWAEDILVDAEGRVTGLVDSTALWGDPELEFAVLDYCGISEPRRP